METKIIVLSGRKQAGKNTFANQMWGMALQTLGLIEIYHINEKGRLEVPVEKNGDVIMAELDLENPSCELKNYLESNCGHLFKTYSYADSLKRDVCINILGLSYESVYGTDEQKNAPTHIMWESFPGVYTDGPVPAKWAKHLYYHEPGNMTGREVLQFVGTEIFRKMYGNCWVDATFKKIERDAPILACITDCRFPNEVEGSQKVGAKVIRLTRNVLQDNHTSETALDGYEGFDIILDNSAMDVATQCKESQKILNKLGWFVE